MTGSMLVIDTVYPRALSAIFAQCSASNNSYDDALRCMFSAKFGMSDTYEKFFNDQGWACSTVIANSTALQTLWARENISQISVTAALVKQSALGRVPLIRNLPLERPLLDKILIAQIRSIAPEVVFCFDLSYMSDAVLQTARRNGCLIVGQTNSSLPPDRHLVKFDLLVSSFPFFIDHFDDLGISTLQLDLGFDDRVPVRGVSETRDIKVSFVGGITRVHQRSAILQTLLTVDPNASFFGYIDDDVKLPAEVQARHFGERWGNEAYAVLNSSAVTVNEHGSVDPHLRLGGVRTAGNMRLFEATGCGALLVTDDVPRIDDFFDVGREILTFGDLGELNECVQWALDNPDEAARMASRAQARTLRDHTYTARLPALRQRLEAEIGRR